MKDFHLKPHLCPNCGYLIDVASAMVNGAIGSRPTEKGGPKPGDLSLCLNCRCLHRFKSDMTVELFSKEEEEKLPPEMKTFLSNIRTTCGEIIGEEGSLLESSTKTLQTKQ